MKSRKLSNKEMADLPDDWKDPEHPELGGWENPKVDTRLYYPAIGYIWEVDKETYEDCRDSGVLCQMYNKKYYMGQ